MNKSNDIIFNIALNVLKDQPTLQSWTFTEGELLKFARLIALECARLAMTEHHSTSPADYDDMEPYEQGCDDTASVISGKIHRIFGVE